VGAAGVAAPVLAAAGAPDGAAGWLAVLDLAARRAELAVRGALAGAEAPAGPAMVYDYARRPAREQRT